MVIPSLDLARVTHSHDRLSAVVATLGEDDVRRPTSLPGWTVGHLLTHIARNADSHVRRVEAAISGVMIDQYQGGPDGRQQEIQAGSQRSAVELVEDVTASARAAEAAWQGLPESAWQARSRDAGGLVRPLLELPGRRWQEVEVHLVDLDVGPTHRDWSDEFVLEWLPRTRERMARALKPGIDATAFDPRDELAWLYGRLHLDGVPDPPPWG